MYLLLLIPFHLTCSVKLKKSLIEYLCLIFLSFKHHIIYFGQLAFRTLNKWKKPIGNAEIPQLS